MRRGWVRGKERLSIGLVGELGGMRGVSWKRGGRKLRGWLVFRVPHGKVVFEVGGGGIREEIAKEGMSMTNLLPTTHSSIR